MTPKYIILHTIAYQGKADIDDIRSWHLERGWNDVGYHYYIRRDGEIQPGRPETVQGAHTLGMNSDSLGIAFEGHGDYEPLTQRQRNALCNLYVSIDEKWDIPPQRVSAHREHDTDKTCPGRRVDMHDIRNMLKLWLNVQHLPERGFPDVEPPDNQFERIETAEGDIGIQSATIDPALLDSWEPSIPLEWIESVDEGKGLQRAKEVAERAVRRSKWKRRGVIVLNAIVSAVARVTKIPELNHLKLKTESDMKRVKPYLKQLSTWEGVAAVLGAVGVTIYPEAIVEIVAGVFVIIGGIELWKEEAEDE